MLATLSSMFKSATREDVWPLFHRDHSSGGQAFQGLIQSHEARLAEHERRKGEELRRMKIHEQRYARYGK